MGGEGKPFWRCIVVDDDRDILLSARLLLRDLFEDVATFQSPEDAMAAIDGADVVLLDANFGRGATNAAEGFHWLGEYWRDPQAVVVCSRPWRGQSPVRGNDPGPPTSLQTLVERAPLATAHRRRASHPPGRAAELSGRRHLRPAAARDPCSSSSAMRGLSLVERPPRPSQRLILGRRHRKDWSLANPPNSRRSPRLCRDLGAGR